MRAVICSQWGTPDKLEIGELPSPELKAGQVRIGVRACSLNYADILMIAGQYQVKPPFPFSPGLEVAGDILEIGAKVGHLGHLKVGMRVAAICEHGGLAEEVVVSALQVVPIPDAMAYDSAAAFMIAYGTSHLALSHRAQLQPGEVLLVHGAAGGVGLTAVELGKLLGATVIATASTAEKLELARAYGADHLINYTEDKFVERVKDITGGKGANVIFDPVGGDVFDQSLRCIAWEGRLLVIGFASGRIPQVPANLTLVKNCSIVGLYWGAYAQRDPQTLLRSLGALFGWYQAGKLSPHISHRFTLDEAAQGLNMLYERKARGKVVVLLKQ